MIESPQQFTRRLDDMQADQLQALLVEVREKAQQVTSEQEAKLFTSQIAQIIRRYRIQTGKGVAASPLMQAKELDPHYRERPHLAYLSSRLVNAVRNVERGRNQQIITSMPPRAGKSTLTSKYAPLWILRRHPEWSVVMASHDPTLTTEWAGSIRTSIENHPELGIALEPDAGAKGRWRTVEQGGMYATSVGGSLIGRGARVLIIDDPVSDFAAAHSGRLRDGLWNWWLSVAQTRLEPPYLVLVTMTRWHEDDFAGRLLSPEHEGDPKDWENIRLPALAEADDILKREEGLPLLSPLIEETTSEAIDRWKATKVSVGSYVFASSYQQRPAPAKGAIFDTGWWRYWTTDASKVTDDGRVVYFDPGTDARNGSWVDSWDCAFGSTGHTGAGGWVVGQRWVRKNANRYLIAQLRDRWNFTETIEQMNKWARQDDPYASPYGHLVHRRLIEAKANGPAIISVLKDKISGIKPVNPHTSKEARARAITPEVESGNVFLPHPTDPGNEWVPDFLDELRNFPNHSTDDQVDALTQALSDLRDTTRGSISVPGRMGDARNRRTVPQSLTKAAQADIFGRRNR